MIFLLALVFDGIAPLIAFQLAKSHACYQQCRTSTSLSLDIFGLGPTEVAIMVGAGLVLFGPDRIKERLQAKKAVKGETISEGWVADREERITLMQKNAERVRKRRVLERMSKFLEEGDQDAIDVIMGDDSPDN